METTDLVERLIDAVREYEREMAHTSANMAFVKKELVEAKAALQARVEKLEGALKQLLAEARERGGMLSDGEVMGCAALAEGGPHE